MTVLLLVLFCGTSLASIVPLASLPLANLFTNGQEYSTTGLQPQTFGIFGYTDAQPQLLVYNVPVTVPSGVFANGVSAIPQIPTAYNYYGTPTYDFRFPLTPVLPGDKPVVAGRIPKPVVPTSTKSPLDEDKIEKLDEKVEPGLSIESSSAETPTNNNIIL